VNIGITLAIYNSVLWKLQERMVSMSSDLASMGR
jgi:hypothetical protein